jgi:hypothetical protein
MKIWTERLISTPTYLLRVTSSPASLSPSSLSSSLPMKTQHGVSFLPSYWTNVNSGLVMFSNLSDLRLLIQFRFELIPSHHFTSNLTIWGNHKSMTRFPNFFYLQKYAIQKNKEHQLAYIYTAGCNNR